VSARDRLGDLREAAEGPIGVEVAFRKDLHLMEDAEIFAG
jgi:hypothetical protein